MLHMLAKIQNLLRVLNYKQNLNPTELKGSVHLYTYTKSKTNFCWQYFVI